MKNRLAATPSLRINVFVVFVALGLVAHSTLAEREPLYLPRFLGRQCGELFLPRHAVVIADESTFLTQAEVHEAGVADDRIV